MKRIISTISLAALIAGTGMPVQAKFSLSRGIVDTAFPNVYDDSALGRWFLTGALLYSGVSGAEHAIRYGLNFDYKTPDVNRQKYSDITRVISRLHYWGLPESDASRLSGAMAKAQGIRDEGLKAHVERILRGEALNEGDRKRDAENSIEMRVEQLRALQKSFNKAKKSTFFGSVVAGTGIGLGTIGLYLLGESIYRNGYRGWQF